MPEDPVMMPTTNNFTEARLRQEGQPGLICPEWYTCFLDYNSLVQENNDISEQKKKC